MNRIHISSPNTAIRKSERFKQSQNHLTFYLFYVIGHRIVATLPFTTTPKLKIIYYLLAMIYNFNSIKTFTPVNYH